MIMVRWPPAVQRRRPGLPPKVLSGRPCWESKPPAAESPRGFHFFRVIFQKMIEDKKLRIPLRLFVKRVGSADQLSDMARLCVPNGNEWQVKITEYGKNEDKTKYKNHETECDDFRKRTMLDQTRRKKPRTDNEMASSCKNNKNKEKMEVCCSKQYLKFSRIQSLSKEGRKKAILAADTFEPINPAFKVLLRSYNFERSMLLVPSSFASKYMTRVYEEAEFVCPDGRKFGVRISLWGPGLAFGKGWAAISQHIMLKEGDVVMLELINSFIGYLFKIRVFRS
ncbi:hypothetical protein JCGZ_10022 [Jatropha curcas]|uniref:TF-B3 domain-containing protein n=1 Tax=Jatropha curcas TaxID=180498 RepID=A0A067LCQ8_JATCU|nr:hypothetical protein JCGZ_10022 [Jatropha curcas]